MALNANHEVIPPIPAEQLPVHVGFIMDGNGRWAKKRGMPRSFGHIAGGKTYKAIQTYCRDIGIRYVSFYVFSTENWSRSLEEINGIYKMMRTYLDDVLDHLSEGIRWVFVGDISAFPKDIYERMRQLEEDTKNNTELTVMMCCNYGGRAELTRSARQIAELVQKGELSPEDITEKTVSEHLYTAEFPDVDLMIRPSGEQRLSNFLIWQCAYAEFYFTNILWPDFTTDDLDAALVEYSKRGRRFGGA